MAQVTIIPDGTVTFSCGSQHVVRVLVPKGPRPPIPDADEEGDGERGRGGTQGGNQPRGRGSEEGDDDGGGSSDGPIFVPPPIMPFLARRAPQERKHLSVLRVRSVDELNGMLGDMTQAWGDHPTRPSDLVVYLAQTEIDIPRLTSVCNQLPDDTNVTVVLTAGDA